MAKIVIDEDGDKLYYNDKGRLHREDGPAMISPKGDKIWMINGIRNDSSRPSDIDANGTIWWAISAGWHRVGGPAIDYPNGFKECMEWDEYVWPKLE